MIYNSIFSIGVIAMNKNSLILPIDKRHILRKSDNGWDYIVQETDTFKKSYPLYQKEVDVMTYNFDGYKTDNRDLVGGIVVELLDNGSRYCPTYDLKGKIIRKDHLSMLQITENLNRCTSDLIVSALNKKKKFAVALTQLQPVELPLDDDHILVQSPTGLWRYESKLSNKIYVFYWTEIHILSNTVIVTLYDRNVRLYKDKKPLVENAKDVLIFLLSKEKERYFENSVECPINSSFVVNRRGWGKYIHFLDQNLLVHAFMLGSKDETPHTIPHILDIRNASSIMSYVVLHEDAYEDYIVHLDTGKYEPTGQYFAAVRLAKPGPKSPFKNQKQLIEKYLKQDARAIQGITKR